MGEDKSITGWLVRREGEQMITANMMEPRRELRLPKLKQIRLNSAGELENSNENVPEGWKRVKTYNEIGSVTATVKVKQTKLTSFMKKSIKTNNNNIKDDNIMSTMVRK